MTTLEIKEMLEQLNIPLAYHHFPASKSPKLPFMAYNYPSINPFYADSTNYTNIVDLDIRLCTETKNFELEQELEDILTAHDIPFWKTETWIDEEKMFEILYECEVMINGN